jgi:hypothetical protein
VETFNLILLIVGTLWSVDLVWRAVEAAGIPGCWW